jgi:phage baseplate assembly protein V
MTDIRPIDDQEVFELGINTAVSKARSAAPGIIQSFDEDAVTCVVSLSLKANYSGRGNAKNKVAPELPLLVDVPVIFPRGGGVTLTFPIKAGDECLVVFADRCIDFWWQSGGSQERVDNRKQDLSDAFVIPGPQSQAQKISGISTSAAQLRTDDGAAFIELEPISHAVTVTTSGKLTATAQETTLNGPVVFNGPVTFNSTVTQSEGKGDASFGGNINAKGDIKAGNIRLQEHAHGGVQTGSDSTGKPQ